MNQITTTKNERVFILVLAFIWNLWVYFGARFISGDWHHYNVMTFIDRLIPLLPWTVSIYFGCYLFWCVNYYLCAKQDDLERNRFFCADILAKGCSFLFFLIFPTTCDRPEIMGDSIWDALMKWLYQIDAPDNLFPSLHCLTSWLCWIGVRKRKDVSVLYRYFSLAMAVAVCISTLTTKQHGLLDVIGGILLAETCYDIAKIKKVSSMYSATMLWIKNIFTTL